MKFVNLYVQTEYSMLSSTIALDKLFEVAVNDGCEALAITDYGMHGAIKFYNLCTQHHIKPIIGLRAELDNPKGTIVLLYAKSFLGYKNLMKIASYQAIHQTITWDVLSKNALDILTILPGDENDVVKSIKEGYNQDAYDRLRNYLDTFSDLYIGIDMQTTEMRRSAPKIIEFAHDYGVPCVAIHKSNYLLDDDFEAYITLRAIDVGVNQYAYTEKEKNSAFLSDIEASLMFRDYPSLISNTLKIASQIDVSIEFHTYRFPSFGIENSHQYLIDLCKLGLNKRLKNRKVNVEVYKKRLFYELSIIERMGFCDYFLIVYDYVRFAKQQDMLVGPGRGSAPGSLVSYVLGITDIDPLAFDLLFERFLNPERITMPDIDVDFPDDRRDEVIQYVGSRYGKNRVAHITTFGTFGARLAIRDVARIIQYSDVRLQAIMRLIPSIPNVRLTHMINQSQELQDMMTSDEQTATLLRLALKLEGLPRHTSTHAAGIIMADKDLVEYTPLQEGMNQLYQTQYEASDLESLGLIKMDILGLRNLTIMKNVILQVQEKLNQTITLSLLPLDDEKVYQMIAMGDTDGLFQLESRGMRHVLMDLKTSTFMDIVNANALFRPGPMEMIPTFVKRKFGEPIEYLHNDLKDILQPTYGTIVFQEQILIIAQKFAGYTLGMADILRRAVSKKDAKLLESERERFVKKAVERGYTTKLSHDVYDYIIKFGNYGFNKSHSVAYSLIAYHMGYLKVHYYPFFMAVLMTNSLGSHRLLHTYASDCKKKHVNVFSPDINHSTSRFEVQKEGIYFSLLAINGVGNVIVDEILKERTLGLFESYEDFVFRCKSIVNQRIVANLIHACAFDAFGLTHKQMIETYDSLNEKQGFFKLLKDKMVDTTTDYDEYSFDEISFYEKEALGFNLKYNLFVKFAPLREQRQTTNLDQLVAHRSVTILFIVRRIRTITTKKGDEMAFLEIYDDTDQVDAVLFPEPYRRIKKDLVTGMIFLAQAKVEERKEKIQVIIENVYSVK